MNTIARAPSVLVTLFSWSCAFLMLPNATGQTPPLADAGPAGAIRSEPAPPETREASSGELTAEDWTDIRMVYEASRHAATPTENGYQARNPGQRWSTHFDGQGSLTEPDGGGWQWGLELESYGFDGHQQRVTDPSRIVAEGQRVTYVWNADLREWYVNDRRGLEHGFTVERRPPRDPDHERDSLTFRLAVRGTLRPEVGSNGRGVRFLDERDAVVLTYSGLLVFDAENRELKAHFVTVEGGLCLIVDDRGARYPLTIDPWAQHAYLKASNTDPDDLFGVSVGISGDTVVVGASQEASAATGVNGDESNNNYQYSGAAYIFVRGLSGWYQQAYLKASNTNWGDLFGEAVAISGDTIVVGAWAEDSSDTGVNGNELDNSAEKAGAAYVFVREGTTWSQQAYLKASNTQIQDWFGESVAIDGDTILVGALGEDSSATGVNGNQYDDSAATSGAVYVFARSGTTWSQQAYIKASNTEESDWFSRSVSISSDTMIVGAPSEWGGSTGVNGNQNDNSKQQAGAAYVFVRSGTTWSQQAYIKASNTDGMDLFGHSVSVSGDTAVVGAPFEKSSATGVNGDQHDNSCYYSGAAYVFVREGTTWSQEVYLKASNTDPDDYFGEAVVVEGDTLVVGASDEDSGATVVNGDQGNGTEAAGAAYLFVRRGTTWDQDAYLKAFNAGAIDFFGRTLDLSEGTVVSGAYCEDSNATGVNGDGSDDSFHYAGAAYVFGFPVPGAAYCFGDPGQGIPCPCANDNDGSLMGAGCANGVFASGAGLFGTGLASASDDSLVLTTIGLEPDNTGLYFQADNRLGGGDGVHFGDGLRCAGGSLVRLQVVTADAAGASSTTVGIAAKGGIQAGQTKRYQCWYRTTDDPPCGLGVWDFNLSNGYEITWTP